MNSEIKTLYDEILKIGYYPGNTCPVCGGIQGNVFFPGGTGMLKEKDMTISDKKVMVVGEQYTSNLDFVKAHGLKEDRILTTPGWHNLLALLMDSDTDPEQCFFTNAFLGMRLIGGSGTKDSAYYSKYFEEQCRRILRMEMEIQKPVLILVFGIKAARFLSWLHPKLEPWSSLKNLAEADRKKLSVINNVPLTGSFLSNLVLLVHPVGRQAHIGNRIFGNYSGDAAEIGMIKSAGRKLEV